MRSLILRVSIDIIVSLCLVLLLLFRPEIPIMKTEVAEEKPALRIPVKLTAKNLKEEFTQSEKEIFEENTLMQEPVAFPLIGAFVDADSFEDSNFQRPVLDINKIFSRIVYPSSMRKRNVETYFKIRVNIDLSGNVTVFIPDNVPQAFRDSVLKAFDKETAIPAYYNSIPVDSTFIVPVNFSLK